MNYKTYLQESERTAASPDPVMKRLTPESVGKLAMAFQMFANWGQVLDQLKKEVFYGKPIQDMVPSLEKVCDGPLPIGDVHYVQNHTNLLHGLLGKTTEAAEIAEVALKLIQENLLDAVNLKEEIGDDDWYDAMILRELARDLNSGEVDYDAAARERLKIYERNIAKLRKRFPDKFTNEHALNRDLEAELEVLEADNGSNSEVSPAEQ